ncbi:MAG: adenylate kinase family protein [Minisyncoccales bacterium]
MKYSKKPRVIILLGRPGSGKGTQARLLCQKFNLIYFGAGDALRARQKKGDFTAKKLIKVMNQGKLVPRFVIAKLWIDKMEEFKKQKNFRGFICDGSPRILTEAELFDEALAWYEWDKRTKVFLIDISAREAIERLTKRRQCQRCKKIIPWIGEFKKLERCDECHGKLVVRPDDKIGAIKSRLAEFQDKVMKVVRYYQKQNKLIKINGEQSIEGVFKDILQYLR